MGFMDVLASILNPNPGTNRLVGGVGDPNMDRGNYLSQTGAGMMPQQAPQPNAFPPAPGAQAPQPASVGYPMPQQQGGGLLSRIFGGGQQQDNGANETYQWLLQQPGMDPGSAQYLMGDKTALQGFIRDKMKPQEAEKPIEINGRLVDPHDYHVLADFHSDPNDKPPADIQGYRLAQSQGYNGTFEDWSTKGVRTQGKEFTQYQDTRKEIQQLPSYKAYTQAISPYNSMLEASKRNTKAADLNLVYGLAKIFDPTSVVREGEVVMANDTQGVADRLNGMIQGIQGKGALEPAARKALLDEARSRMEGFKASFDTDLSQYRDMAKNFGLDEKYLIPRVPDMGQFPDLADPASPGGAGNLPVAPPVGDAPAAPQAPAPAQQAPQQKTEVPNPRELARGGVQGVYSDAQYNGDAEGQILKDAKEGKLQIGDIVILNGKRMRIEP